MMGTMNNSPLITDWIMVGITAVYVVATVLILLANRKAVKAAKEQLEESKREFEETRRLGLMPYICISETNTKLTDYDCNFDLVDHIKREATESVRINIENIGLGTAKDIACLYRNFESESENLFPLIALQSGEKHSICFIFHYPSNQIMHDTAYVVLRYKDLLDRSYQQKYGFEFDYDRQNDRHIVRRIQVFPPEFLS